MVALVPVPWFVRDGHLDQPCFKGEPKIHRAKMAVVNEAMCLLHLEPSRSASDRVQQPNFLGNLVGNLVGDMVGIRCPGMFVRLCPYVGIWSGCGREETTGLKLGRRAALRPNVLANAPYAGTAFSMNPIR